MATTETPKTVTDITRIQRYGRTSRAISWYVKIVSQALAVGITLLGIIMALNSHNAYWYLLLLLNPLLFGLYAAGEYFADVAESEHRHYALALREVKDAKPKHD